MFDFDLTENDMAELDEELEKSKLPDSVKTAILASKANN